MSSDEPEHLLDPHPLDDNDESGEEQFEFSQSARQVSGDTPPRALFWGAIYAVIGSAVVALIAGAVAASSPPNSYSERLGSGFYRLAGYCLLGSFSSLLLAYRYRALVRFLRRQQWWHCLQAGSFWLNPIVILALLNTGVLLSGLVAAYLVGFMISESSSVTALAFILMNASLAATMAIMQRGVIKAYGIGFLASLIAAFAALLFGGGMIPLFRFRLDTSEIFVRIELFHIFLMANGLLSAGFYFLTTPRGENANIEKQT